LFHMSERFDGTLHKERRHARLPGAAFHEAFQPLLRRYLEQCPEQLLEGRAWDGEVIMRHWLARPAPFYHLDERGQPTRPGRRTIFTEAQLFYGPARMITLRR